MCFNELNMFMRRKRFLYLLKIVSFFLFYNAFILKIGSHFFNEKLKWTSHGILHYMSGSIKKLVSTDCVVSIFILSPYFFHKFASWESVELPYIAYIVIH